MWLLWQGAAEAPAEPHSYTHCHHSFLHICVVETPPVPMKTLVEVECTDLWVTGNTATATMKRKSQFLTLYGLCYIGPKWDQHFLLLNTVWTALSQRPWKCHWRRQIKVRERLSYNIQFMIGEVKYRHFTDHLLCTCHIQCIFKNLLFGWQRNTCIFKHGLHGGRWPYGKICFKVCSW